MSSPAIQAKTLENLPERIKIDTLEITGFRGIKHAKIELRDINVLIGANGAGKSNILLSVYLLSERNHSSFRQFFNGLGGNDSLFYGGVKLNSKIKIKITLADKKKLTHATQIDYISGGQVEISQISNAESKSGQKLTLFNFDDQKQEIYSPVRDTATVNILVEHSKKISELFGNLGIYKFCDTSPMSPIRQPSLINDNVNLRGMGENLSAWIYLFSIKQPKQFSFFQSLVRRVVPRFDCFVLRPDPFNENQIRLEYRNLGQDLLLSAAHLSDGSLRFIALAVLLLFNPPPLIIIDEPELGLHPTALQLIADLIRQASFESQIIVATQSVDFLNQFEPHQILVVEREEDSEETLVKRLDATELEGWLEDYSVGDLWLKNVLGGKP